jgi:hypothetical protein
MRPALALCALVALALVQVDSAFAADPVAPAPTGDATLTSKIEAAIASATSYRIAVTGGPLGLTLDIREFGPDRVRIASRSTVGASESIVVGTAMYYRAAGGEWKAYPVPPVTKVRRNRLYMAAPDTLLSPLEDRTESGETLGAFRSVATGNAQLPGTMDCTYDKVTFRPRTCNVTLRGVATPLQVTYAGWDDPTNAVEPPSGVPEPTPLPKATAAPKLPAPT